VPSVSWIVGLRGSSGGPRSPSVGPGTLESCEILTGLSSELVEDIGGCEGSAGGAGVVSADAGV